jgi:tetratricopeptide (TPR) repeat protein
MSSSKRRKRRAQRHTGTVQPSANRPGTILDAPPLLHVSIRRLWLFRLTSVFLAPFLLLTVLELGLRLGHYGYPTGFFIEPDSAGIKVTNYKFGWRFFAPAIARIPEPYLLSAKAPGTIRVFVFGGSVALGVPNPHFSFGRILEVMLRERHPGVTFEVVNVAMTAINSHVVLEIAHDCSALQPDLFVVYMGNNEVVGPYGPGVIFKDWSPSLPLIRTTLLVKKTRTGQLLAGAMRSLHPDGRPTTWRGMIMAMDNPVAADDPRLIPTHENFRRNLTDVCRVGRRAGAAVVLSTVPVNLKDCPPFASRHRADLRTGELDKWESVYRAGIEREDNKQWHEALIQYELAARLDDRFAELQFRMGKCLAALGRSREARERFLAACDLDVLRFRADRKINKAIREVSAEQSADGVYLADAEHALAASASETGDIPGKDVFFEHVHPTFGGNYLLARTLLVQVERALPQLAALRKTASVLSKQQCAQALTMTPWDEYQSFVQMADMISPPPFSNQLGHAERIAAIRERTRSLAKLSSRPESRRLYEAALEKAPDDWSLHYRYGQILLAAGESQPSADHMHIALKVFPWNLPLLVDVAKAESMNGRNKEAVALFQKALKLYPNHLVAYSGLVAALAHEGRIDDATAYARKAAEADPSFNGAHIALGAALDERGDAKGAIAQFRKAVEINPEEPLAYENLGATLADRGRVDEAITNFRKALKINPNLEAAHVNLGIALASQGDVQEAMAHFRAALETNPKNPITCYSLGSALASRGRIAEAVNQFRRAVEVAPDYYDAHVSLGLALTGGNVHEAMAHFQKAREIDPKNPVAYYHLGVALAGQGRVDEAAIQFRKALDVNPNYAAAHLGLGKIAGEQGRVDEAVIHVRRAIDIDPGNEMAYYMMGQLSAYRGRIDVAIASYMQALMIRPDFVDARRRLQQLQNRAGRNGSGSLAKQDAQSWVRR